MHTKNRFIMLAILAALGVYLLGDGLTGLVTASDTCTTCIVQSEIYAIWGALMLVVVVVAIAIVYHLRTKEKPKK